MPEAEPGHGVPDKAAVEGQKAALENIKQVGQTAVPAPEISRIHCVSIVGQVEGHILLPPRNKTTKYEHIIPQLVAVEQSPEIQEYCSYSIQWVAILKLDWPLRK